ncbi:uncharacterized protein LOC108153357 isoform X2 [Drosophila miranda]|uniref:uncharacterized protein LOC108153357 isoform X2 n=1 Tax=Drosophila miranda TaxID=7229 RepID=UPI0007E837C4|nr:uncharacterized protein LOC108153357 isoform X2 [Drosophila miranda]
MWGWPNFNGAATLPQFLEPCHLTVMDVSCSVPLALQQQHDTKQSDSTEPYCPAHSRFQGLGLA